MRIGVVIDRRGPQGDLDLAFLADELSDTATPVVLVQALSAAGLRAIVRAEHLDGLVVAGRDEENIGPMAEDALHAAGADRLALRLVNLRELCAHVHRGKQATEKARSLLAAAVAMLRRYRRWNQANVRIRLGAKGGRVSRRSLLTVPMLRYEAVPSIAKSRCAASRGCNLCLAACPVAAISFEGGAAHIQKERCRDCGLCLAACPADAIDHPIYGREVLNAGLEAILTGRADIADHRVVAFACPGAMETLRQVGRHRLSYPAAILPLEVPSAGFVDWYLVLRAFDLGAGGVAILTCEEACRHGCTLEEVNDRFAAMARLLEAVGLESGRLAVVNEGSAQRLAARLNAFVDTIVALPEQPLSQTPPSSPEDHGHQLARLLTAISRRLDLGDGITLEGESVPFGEAILNSGACSLCGLCADGCPTGALTYVEEEGQARLLFAARDCSGCSLCSAICPEGALAVQRRLDLTALQSEGHTLKSAELIRCQRCGEGFASEAMLAGVLSRLAGRAESLVTLYCPDCRMIAGAPGRPG